MKDFIKIKVLIRSEVGVEVKVCEFVDKRINSNMINDITPTKYPLPGIDNKNNYVPAIRIDQIDQDDYIIFEDYDDRDEMLEKIDHATVKVDLTK